MLDYSLLYPCNNQSRTSFNLDGLWKFRFDPESRGQDENWENGIPDPITMPVPASFSDFFTNGADRDYCGDFWYELDFFLPEFQDMQESFLRFGSITHRAVVYVNGKETVRHEGGFLPVIVPLKGIGLPGQTNRLVVKVNNELNETCLPCGSVKTLKSGRKIARPYFDFFNYSGIQRSVWLLSVPAEAVQDYDLTYELDGNDAQVHYSVRTNGEHAVNVILYDRDGAEVARTTGKEGKLVVKDARLWKVRDAYLYRLVIQIVDGDSPIDEYTAKIGIRTVKIEGTRILVNNEPVYLKGYGKHEDFDVLGKGFSWAVAKRDFECMKWSGANCFRTSHYPYAEEWYQLADEEGFLIIDEVPAVGMMKSFANFVDAGTGKYTCFFEGEHVPQLKAAHLLQTEEMIVRDKNHPSVFAWSLFNEPETTSSYAKEYFTDIFRAARELDPQKRPLTGALVKDSSPEKCQCYQLCDFISLNRYYGWYISGGPEMEEAKDAFIEEMKQWEEKDLNVPFIFTEFGADTLALEHKLPSVMWSQEYQNEYMQMNFEVFDRFDFVQGELVWNFADFQTTEGIMRVNGNKKGVFTRNRQPKDVAFKVKERWEKL